MYQLFRTIRPHTSGRGYFLLPIIAFCASMFANPPAMRAQPNKTLPVQIRYDEAAHTFRMDAAGVSYIFGVNQDGELQTLYWGKRLRAADPIPEARVIEGSSAFDLRVNATPQEFTGWGGGLVVVPDLKITFPDGNRDLVLHTRRIPSATMS
jgi:alpha-galactosidase